MDPTEILVSQYGAALEMLRRAIEICPEHMWNEEGHRNRSWHIAYHAIFYMHLYLSRSVEAFVPWQKHLPEYNFLGPLPWPPHAEPRIGPAYSRAEVLEYCDLVSAQVAAMVRALPLEGPSGFDWYPCSRHELHINSIRHVQHHAGQLIDRIRQGAGIGVDWVRAKAEGD